MTNATRAPTHGALALRDYQVAALDAIGNAEARGVRRQLVVLPTGSGKTVIFAHLIKDRPGRALVLAHRDELIGQAAAKLQMVDPAAEIGVVKAERDEVLAPTVVASVQTLAVPGRLKRLWQDGDDFATVVVDEAHHTAAPTYGKILAQVGAGESTGPLLVGVTATADRGDGIGLDGCYDEIVYSADLLGMIRHNPPYLADVRAIQVQLDASLDDVHTRAGDLVASEVGKVLHDADAPTVVARAWTEHAAGRCGLVFTPTVAVAYEMAEAFRAQGVTAEALDGTTPIDERRAILRRLSDGATSVVANCAVLTEGFDEPRVDTIVVARPTKSRALYTQMVGRGTRLYPGKDHCLILDVVGVTGRHKLVTAPSLLGLDPAVVAEKGAREAAEQAEQLALGTFKPTHGQLVAQHVELFDDRPERWIKAGNRFVLNLGNGHVALEPSPDGWRVVRTGADRQRKLVADGLDLGYAQGVAVDLVHAEGAKALNDPKARWRSKPASEKQLQALRSWKVVFPQDISSGDASDLLSATIASRGRGR